MLDQNKIKRDMETLLESIRLDWVDLAKNGFNPQERENVRKHIQWCIEELKTLEAQLNSDR
jgi:hypothetical protein